jgi:hypothetical protein
LGKERQDLVPDLVATVKVLLIGSILSPFDPLGLQVSLDPFFGIPQKRTPNLQGFAPAGKVQDLDRTKARKPPGAGTAQKTVQDRFGLILQMMGHRHAPSLFLPDQVLEEGITDGSRQVLGGSFLFPYFLPETSDPKDPDRDLVGIAEIFDPVLILLGFPSP